MDLLVDFFVVYFVFCPIILYLIGRKEDKKTNNERKRSSILFNSTVLERNVTPEDVFKTLDEAGIEPAFLQTK